MSLALVAAILTGLASAAGAAPPSWQTVPVTKPDDHMAVVAADRVWVFNNGADSGPFVMKSARISGSKLGPWSTATLGGSSGWLNEGLHGQDLVFLTSSGRQGELLSVRLQPSGGLGKPVITHGAPAPSASGGSAVIQLPDRVVRVVDACDYGVPGCASGNVIRMGICCDTNADVRDYSSLIPPSQSATTLLGLDRHGRLWLAWAPYRQSLTQQAQLVQLDPATLAPRGKFVTVPGALGFTQMLDFACADVCHLVMYAVLRAKRTSGTFSWAAGETSATLIAGPDKGAAAIAVRASARHLDLAYGGHDQKGVLTVALVRASPRGTNPKPAGDLVVPPGIGSASRGVQLTIGPVGTFGTEGFLAVTVYEPFSGSGKAQVRVALLPLRP